MHDTQSFITHLPHTYRDTDRYNIRKYFKIALANYDDEVRVRECNMVWRVWSMIGSDERMREWVCLGIGRFGGLYEWLDSYVEMVFMKDRTRNREMKYCDGRDMNDGKNRSDSKRSYKSDDRNINDRNMNNVSKNDRNMNGVSSYKSDDKNMNDVSSYKSDIRGYKSDGNLIQNYKSDDNGYKSDNHSYNSDGYKSDGYDQYSNQYNQYNQYSQYRNASSRNYNYSDQYSYDQYSNQYKNDYATDYDQSTDQYSYDQYNRKTYKEYGNYDRKGTVYDDYQYGYNEYGEYPSTYTQKYGYGQTYDKTYKTYGKTGLYDSKENYGYADYAFYNKQDCLYQYDSKREFKNQECAHCGTKITSLWRKLHGDTVCNACGLYYKIHGIKRPETLKGNKVRRRKRIPRKKESCESG